MADREPRRRKKRKDSQKKDDFHSEDQIFMPLRSESKDSDQDNEEEIPVPIHQPSGFAKLVFVILFSGLVLSMSFIFISLHGAERGAIDLFDDHHSEEQTSSQDYELIENISSISDHSEGSESLSSSADSHDDEIESWSSSEFLSENLMNMLPDIGNILSFNDEKVKESEETILADEKSVDHADISEQGSQQLYEDSAQDSLLNELDEDVKETVSADQTLERSDFISTLEYDIDEKSDFHESLEALSQATDEVITDSTNDDLELISELQASTLSSGNVQETITDIPSSNDEKFSPVTDNIYDGDEEPEILEDKSHATSLNYEEEDEEEIVYEKTFLTNEEDYEIRDELDELDQILEKSAENALKKCNEIMKIHEDSPRLNYVKAQALDKLAEQERSNKILEDAILTYQGVLDLKNVPKGLYLLAGKKAAERMRFRGFMGKSLKLLTRMMSDFPDNVELKNLVAVGYLLIGQNKAAKKEFQNVLEINPGSGFAKVHLGFILKTDESNYEKAIQLMSEGIASKEDGVIDGRFYFHLGDALHRVGKKEEALKLYDEAVKLGLFMSRYQRSLYNVKGLTAKPWWDPKETPYVPFFKILERDWSLIRNEVLSLTNQDNSGFSPESEGLQDTGDWKQLELFARGKKIEKNCVKAPKTCAIIAQIPDAVNCKRGQVKFSIMNPSTHVWAHTGPTNCRLRAHLGLVVPEGAEIRVAEETRKWKEGKILLFDDSFEHEVWHNGNSSRLVLIVDFWHPDLTPYQKRSLTPI